MTPILILTACLLAWPAVVWMLNRRDERLAREVAVAALDAVGEPLPSVLGPAWPVDKDKHLKLSDFLKAQL